jgi:dTDP-4-dehydrorhamnose reductase
LASLELWGGHECTVNRVGNRYQDQTVLSGHHDRVSDLALFADLGVRSLRYPVLWEKVSPKGSQAPDFSWPDARLTEIRRLGMNPIGGLIHHGSGPLQTSLVDDEGFAPGLAAHARATAERYPWVRDWTPVNEPLTTARFSALYGIWYPHARSEWAFWRALLNQIDATRLAMREIRRVNPEARLIQTEDLGFCHATPQMAAQAEYENERRWITWDLLCGRVTPDHPLWGRLAAWGLSDRLQAISDDPCPPDVLGLNHYLSSERLLDHRVELYPEGLSGGDGPAPYVNIEAIRTVAAGPLGIGTLLKQAHDRYGREIAVTECHNGCTREEQMRWFHEVWRAVQAVRDEGVPVTAVTAWGLLGSFDWNKLLAQEAGHYECGVFDLRAGRPEPTAMVGLLKDLAAGRDPHAPVLGGAGWWRRPDRFFDQVVDLPEPCARTPLPALPTAPVRPLLIVGSGCALEDVVADACRLRHLAFACVTSSRTDAENVVDRLRAAIDDLQPWAVLNLGGAGEAIAQVALSADVPVASMATTAPRRDPLPGELLVTVDTALSHRELKQFAREVIDNIGGGQRFRAASNRVVPAVYLPDAAHRTLDLLIDGHTGATRLTSGSRATWAELAVYIAREASLDSFLVEPSVVPSIGRPPTAAVFDATLTLQLPNIYSAAQRTVAAWKLVATARTSCPLEPAPAMSDGLQHAAE